MNLRARFAAVRRRVLAMKPLRPTFGMMVGIEVRDANGNVTGRYCSGWRDLATNNFRDFMAAMFTPVTAGASNSFSHTNEGGTSRSSVMWISGSTVSRWNDSSLGGVGPKICLGDGSGSAVTPARTDTNLVNQLYEAFSSAASVGTGIFTISASFSNGSGSTQTIREAGVKMAMRQNSTNTTEDFLWFHDATSATSVPNGSSVTCTYTFALP